MLRRHFLAALATSAAPIAAAADAPWPLLKEGGRVVLMRHAATVPGVGDPAGFTLGQCATQRNLSPVGREDAARIGAAFRRHGIPIGPVLSSRWCRCADTAQLAFGHVRADAMLDSMFHDDPAARARKLATLKAYLARHREAGNIVLVTHDVNIRAMVGKYVEQGDFIIASASRDGRLTIEATVPVAGLLR